VEKVGFPSGGGYIKGSMKTAAERITAFSIWGPLHLANFPLLPLAVCSFGDLTDLVSHGDPGQAVYASLPRDPGKDGPLDGGDGGDDP